MNVNPVPQVDKGGAPRCGGTRCSHYRTAQGYSGGCTAEERYRLMPEICPLCEPAVSNMARELREAVVQAETLRRELAVARACLACTQRTGKPWDPADRCNGCKPGVSR